MQASVINSKKIIAFLAALVLNLLVFWAFAQLFNVLIVKQQKVYTVYIYTNQNTNFLNSKQTKNTNFAAQKNPLQNKNIQKTSKKNAKETKPLSRQLEIAQNSTTLTKTSSSALDIKNNATTQSIKKEQTKQNSSLLTQDSGFSKSNSENSYANLTDIQTQPQIANWIEKHKFYPQKAIFKGEQGKIKLVFFIDRDGSLQNISILEKSQYDTLNKAAIKILYDSSPIPKKLLTNVNLPFYAKINIVFKLE